MTGLAPQLPGAAGEFQLKSGFFCNYQHVWFPPNLQISAKSSYKPFLRPANSENNKRLKHLLHNFAKCAQTQTWKPQTRLTSHNQANGTLSESRDLTESQTASVEHHKYTAC